ncbi:MAG: hypothetical protein ACI9N9_002365 [Enterobacterales bacterium]|jgi:hypothetical protein
MNDLPDIFPLSNKKRRNDRDLHIHQLRLDGYCQQKIGKAYKMPASRVDQIFTEQTEKKLKERIAELKHQVEQALIYVSEMHNQRKQMSLIEIVNASGSEQAKQEYQDLINALLTQQLTA